MKIIVGLGNIGQKYQNTRHNTGFILLDRLAYNKNSNWSENKKLSSKICRLNSDTIFVKPQTFMNKSGKAVSKVLSYFKDSSTEDLIVVHDDVDLEFGEVKMQKGRSSAGHKGVQDIIDKLRTSDFWRFRVGVGKSENQNISTEDWVLQNFTEEQLNTLKNEVFKLLLEKIDE